MNPFIHRIKNAVRHTLARNRTEPDTDHRYQLGYRADIEGLRALAILLVVAAHAGVPWLPGGFVGVDVFFVLSGYLISGLLIEEIRSTGNLQFARFYARRLRRLLPALALMLLGASLLGWLLLPVIAQTAQAASAANAAAWISNIYFAQLRLGYFDPDSGTNLFLHTWSLGVEEQFYLAWPLLIFITWKVRKHTEEHSAYRRVVIVMATLLAASLLIDLVWTRTSPEMAFYMMPARAWQFALGALVYMVARHRNAAVGTGNVRSLALFWVKICGWLGAALIVLSAMFLDGGTAYPGAWALLPSTGAAAVLACGAASPSGTLARLLSLKPMQRLGRVSYAWYLWHWPLLLLGTKALGYTTGLDRALLVLLSLLVAIISYHAVERPFRRIRWINVRPKLGLIASIVVMTGCIAAANGWNQEAAQQRTSPQLTRYLHASQDAPIIYLMGCDSWYRSDAVKVCAFGPTEATHTAVIVGDSVALQWFPAVKRVFTQRKWRLIVLTKSSCPMVEEPLYYKRIKREYTTCATWRRKALQKIRQIAPDIVILGSTHTYGFSKHEWLEGTQRVLSAIHASAKKIFILRSTPTLPFDGPSCLAPHSALFRWLTRTPTCSAPAHDARFDRVFAWLKKASISFRNVRMIDMTSAVCPENRCRAQVGQWITFRDDRHMTARFARSLSPYLARQLGFASSQPVSGEASATR